MLSGEMQKNKVLVVGPHGAGKTRLAMGKEAVTIAIDLRIHNIDYDQDKRKISLWEVSGNPTYSQAIEQYYKDTDYALLCISLDQTPEDFQRNLTDELSRHQSKIASQNPLNQNQVPIMLIGTKADLANENGHLAANKQTLLSQLKEGETAFITSAIHPTNLELNYALKSDGTEEAIYSHEAKEVFNNILEGFTPEISRPSYRYSLDELNGKVITLVKFKEYLNTYSSFRDKTLYARLFENSFGSGTIKSLHQLYIEKSNISAQYITGEEILQNVSKKKQSSTDAILQQAKESEHNPLKAKITHGTEHVLILLLQNMITAPGSQATVSPTIILAT